MREGIIMKKKRLIAALLACALLATQAASFPAFAEEETPAIQEETLHTQAEPEKNAEEPVSSIVPADKLKIESNVLKGFVSDYTVPDNAVLVIPKAVTSISNGAFNQQAKIAEISFESGSALKTVGDQAFAGTGITSIILPDAVRTIGKEAFSGCASLIKINILSDTLTSVGTNALANLHKDVKVYVNTASVKTKLSGKGVAADSIIVEAHNLSVSNNGQSLGYFTTFAQAAEAIDAASGNGTFTIQVLKDVELGNKLPSKACIITGSAKLTLAAELELKNNLTFEDITLADSAVSVYASGFAFELGENVKTAGKMSLFGGKKTGEAATADITLLSGTVQNVTVGGSSSTAKITGDATLTIANGATISGKTDGGEQYTDGQSSLILKGYETQKTALPGSFSGFERLVLNASNFSLASLPFSTVNLQNSELTLTEAVTIANLAADKTSVLTLTKGKPLTITNAVYPPDEAKIAVKVAGELAENDVLMKSAAESVVPGAFSVADIPEGLHFIKVGEDLKLIKSLPVDASGVTVSAAGITYGDPLGASELTVAGEFQYEGVTVPGSVAWADGTAILNAGTHSEVTWVFTPDDPLYAPVNGTTAIAVAKRAVTVTPSEGQKKEYGQADPTFTYTVDGLPENMSLAGALAREPGENAGNYKLLAGTFTNENHTNYEITFTPDILFTVEKAAPSVQIQTLPTAQQAGKTVALTIQIGNPHDSSLTDGLPAANEVTVTADAGTVSAVEKTDGVYTATLTIPAEAENNTRISIHVAVAETANYLEQSADTSVLVTDKIPSAMDITLPATPAVYGTPSVIQAAVKAFDSTTAETPSGAIMVYLGTDNTGTKLAEYTIGEEKDIPLDQAVLGAGTHTIYVEYVGDEHFAPTYQTTTLTVAKKDLTIKPENVSIYRKDALPEDEDLGIVYTGFIDGEDQFTQGVLDVTVPFTASIDRTIDTSKTGTYPIALHGEATAHNYNIIKEDGTLKVVNSNSSSSRTRYTLSVSAKTGGTISPSGTMQVPVGETRTFTITPKTGYVIDDVIVNGKSVGAVSKYTYKQNKTGSIIASFRKAGDEDPDDTTYKDIKGHWAEDDILFVTERGLFNGIEKGKFAPEAKITRGMVVTVLGRMEDVSASGSKSTFDDVPRDSYYSAYIAWAAKNDIVYGMDDNLFDPDRAISREEMAVIFSRYMDYKDIDPDYIYEAIDFADNGKIASWAKTEVRKMQRAGIIKGKDNNRFDPQGTGTRAEFAALIRRLIDNQDL